MPLTGSQLTLCDVPVRFDNYKGCSHACQYCFANRKRSIDDIGNGESVGSLKAFIEGQRNAALSWCDWDIPIHWGGMSDPFQPIEEIRRTSLEALKEELHARGMKFYCGENRLRGMSDELCCCGIEGLGWKPNTANLNHYIYDRENFKFTEAQRTKKNQSAFSAANQLTVVNIHTKSRTFEELMMQHAQSARSINALLPDEQHLTTK